MTQGDDGPCVRCGKPSDVGVSVGDTRTGQVVQWRSCVDCLELVEAAALAHLRGWPVTVRRQDN